MTVEIANKNIGKYIDCYKRLFGYYPMKIVEINGNPYVKDKNDVCMPIQKSQDLNSHKYDYIFDMIVEEQPCQP